MQLGTSGRKSNGRSKTTDIVRLEHFMFPSTVEAKCVTHGCGLRVHRGNS